MEAKTTSPSKCRSPGSGAIPEGIVVTNSNLEMRPLWGSPKKTSLRSYLFGVAVGIKQKQIVNKMVPKFLNSNFTVMLFHYDGVVDEWKDLEWSVRGIHVSAFNQTKWWFEKRFLHPDIFAEYDYVFLWDEDLGVENFHPDREVVYCWYISIIEEEGREISQPALDVTKSEVNHQITCTWEEIDCSQENVQAEYLVHAKGSYYRWVEMMAPVFSRAAWRCVWYMIQNDLIRAWGLDMQLGYCAQLGRGFDREKYVGRA